MGIRSKSRIFISLIIVLIALLGYLGIKNYKPKILKEWHQKRAIYAFQGAKWVFNQTSADQSSVYLLPLFQQSEYDRALVLLKEFSNGDSQYIGWDQLKLKKEHAKIMRLESLEGKRSLYIETEQFPISYQSLSAPVYVKGQNLILLHSIEDIHAGELRINIQDLDHQETIYPVFEYVNTRNQYENHRILERIALYRLKSTSNIRLWINAASKEKAIYRYHQISLYGRIQQPKMAQSPKRPFELQESLFECKPSLHKDVVEIELCLKNVSRELALVAVKSYREGMSDEPEYFVLSKLVSSDILMIDLSDRTFVQLSPQKLLHYWKLADWEPLMNRPVEELDEEHFWQKAILEDQIKLKAPYHIQKILVP
jgi:hypothetical protein